MIKRLGKPALCHSGTGALHPDQAAPDRRLPPPPHPPAEDQLPSETARVLRAAHALAAGVQPLRGEDAVVASVRKMSNQQADDCAALIVEIFGALCRMRFARAASGRGRATCVQ